MGTINEVKTRIDAIIDGMNVLSFICKDNIGKYHGDPEHLHADAANGKILIYNNDYFFLVCKQVGVMPEIIDMEVDDTGICAKATANYRGTKIGCYMHSELEKDILKHKIEVYEAEQENKDDV